MKFRATLLPTLPISILASLAMLVGAPVNHKLLPGEPNEADMERCRQRILTWEAEAPQKAVRTMQVMYWTPADREPQPEYRQRLTRVLKHIQEFYGKEMAKWGFPGRTIRLDTEADGLLKIHMVKGTLKNEECSEEDGKDGQDIKKDCRAVLKTQGIDAEKQTMVIFCNLSEWDAEKRIMSHHSPYYASGDSRQGTAWQLDSVLLDPAHLPIKDQKLTDGQYGYISLGKYNSIFVGGVCHELGHALGLPHCRECEAAKAARGTALMGSGNRSYGDELRGEGAGSFLSLPHALKLAVHPQFSGSIKRMDEKLTATYDGLQFSNDELGLTVKGKLTSNLPVHAVLAYGDPDGGGDYDSQIAAGVPQEDGNFQLTVPKPTKKNSGAKLSLVAVAVNGAATAGVWSEQGFTLPCRINADGQWDITAAVEKLSLDALKAGKLSSEDHHKLPPRVQQALQRLSMPNNGKDKPTPNICDKNTLNLSDAAPSKVKIGYGSLGYDRTPEGDALLTSEGVAPLGLFAHADSELIYNLDGKWKTFAGAAAIVNGASGKATATLYAGETVLWKSTALTTTPQPFSVDVSTAKDLRLVFKCRESNRMAWTSWIAPTLTR